jgi:hypothetical protein
VQPQPRHSRHTPLPFDLPAVRRKKLTVDFDGGNQSSDAGLLLLREAERKLGVCRRLAAAMPDRRDPDRILHEMFEMVAARSMAIACGYEDAIDHDRGTEPAPPPNSGMAETLEEAKAGFRRRYAEVKGRQ